MSDAAAMGFDERLLGGTRVMPVLVIETLADAVPIARALLAGGLRALEVTLRTPAAFDAVEAIARDVPGACVGVGSVIDGTQLAEAGRRGAQFAVSPGSTPALVEAARQGTLPWLPGAATATEAMRLLAAGYRWQKFFPAESAGGMRTLAALAGPLPRIRFCPTGGIDARLASQYLTLPNVACVGGSWLAPARLVAARDWPAITALAREAAVLGTAGSAA